MTPDPPWLFDLLATLGWSGGTIHQALDEVRRLHTLSNHSRDTLDDAGAYPYMRDEVIRLKKEVAAAKDSERRAVNALETIRHARRRETTASHENCPECLGWRGAHCITCSRRPLPEQET